jgi:hypothetical protein
MNDLFPQSQETFAEHSANENILRSWVDPNLNLNLNPDVKEFYKNNFGNEW